MPADALPGRAVQVVLLDVQLLIFREQFEAQRGALLGVVLSPGPDVVHGGAGQDMVRADQGADGPFLQAAGVTGALVALNDGDAQRLHGPPDVPVGEFAAGIHADFERQALEGGEVLHPSRLLKDAFAQEHLPRPVQDVARVRLSPDQVAEHDLGGGLLGERHHGGPLGRQRPGPGAGFLLLPPGADTQLHGIFQGEGVTGRAVHPEQFPVMAGSGPALAADQLRCRFRAVAGQGEADRVLQVQSTQVTLEGGPCGRREVRLQAGFANLVEQIAHRIAAPLRLSFTHGVQVGRRHQVLHDDLDVRLDNIARRALLCLEVRHQLLEGDARRARLEELPSVAVEGAFGEFRRGLQLLDEIGVQRQAGVAVAAEQLQVLLAPRGLQEGLLGQPVVFVRLKGRRNGSVFFPAAEALVDIKADLGTQRVQSDRVAERAEPERAEVVRGHAPVGVEFTSRHQAVQRVMQLQVPA